MKSRISEIMPLGKRSFSLLYCGIVVALIVLQLASLPASGQTPPESSNCIEPGSFNFSTCELPPPLIENYLTNDFYNKRAYCEGTYKFITCMTEVMSKFCPNNASDTSKISFHDKINRAIMQYNSTYYEKNCFGKSTSLSYLERLVLIP